MKSEYPAGFVGICIDAQARNSGLTRFIVRGIDKAVACWHGLANNMACSWRFAPA